MTCKNPMGIEELVGKTFTSITIYDDNSAIKFVCDDGNIYNMYHHQRCCEYVEIEDICGDIEDLIGTPILIASEDSNSEMPSKSEYDESYTWTFYNFSTIKGSITIRWYGTSNGFYSESVSIYKENGDR